MRKSPFLFLIIFYVFAVSDFRSQEVKTEIENPDYYSTVTIGGIEFFSFSIGRYIDNLTISVKYSRFGVRTSFGNEAGIGLGINYFFKRFYITNYFSMDYIKIYGDGFKGYGYEVVVGNLTNRETGFGFIYELGVGYSNVIAKYTSPQYQRLVLLGPIIKIGLNYNL